MAIRRAKLAVKHLEKGDVANATKEIDEAVQATHRAGKEGAR